MGFANFVWSAAAPQPGGQPVYRFMPPTTPDTFLHIKLEGMGPKLLVSDLSTADQPILRWRLVVRGNTAVEFGVVPLCLEVRVHPIAQSCYGTCSSRSDHRCVVWWA